MQRRTLRFWLTYLSIVAVAGIVVMEIVVRLLGYTAWNPDYRVDIRVEPGQRLTQTDSLLGYRHLPGSYHVTLPTGLEFYINHDEKSLRLTEPSDSYLEEKPRPEIWVFGGSFVHGWSLNDHETFPWILQSEFPDYEVVNFGVGGYGTIQSMLMMERLLDSGRIPQMVIIAYSALHDERNTFMRSRVKEVSAWNHLGDMQQPAARLDGDDLKIKYVDVSYRAFPLTRFLAVSHCFDLAINKIQHALIDSHEVTRSILSRMRARASSHDIPVILAHIYSGPDSPDLLSWAESEGFLVTDISVDLSENGMSNRPFDAHPSARANEIYAASLIDFLRSDDTLLSASEPVSSR